MGSVVAPVAPSPALRAERHQELEGHRGIAVVAVVVFHVYQFCNIAHFLYLGTPAYTLLNSLDAMVPWFFVLTAFLLFAPIARSAIEGGTPISARRFLMRRVVRLVPVYYVAVAVVWFSRQRSLPGDWRDLLEHLTFTQVFDEKRIFYTIGPAWSLSVEVYFYLGLAALGVGLARGCQRISGHRQRVAVLAGTTGSIAAISVGWKAWAFSVAHRSTIGSFTTWFGPMANLDLFAVGMAIAVVAGVLGDARPLQPRQQFALRSAALAILSVAFGTRRADTWTGVYFSTVCSIGFGCLIAAAVFGPPGDRWNRALSWRPLRWLGAISYSIYLWHEPILLALRGRVGLVRQAPGAFLPDTAVVVVFSVLAGWISYSLIERPTGQLGGLFGRHDHLAAPCSDIHGDNIVWENFHTGNPF